MRYLENYRRIAVLFFFYLAITEKIFPLPHPRQKSSVTQTVFRHVFTLPLLPSLTASEFVGLGSVSDQVYSDGLQVVVNLSDRTLSEAENALLSKGLSFCPTPTEIDVYTLRKNVLNYVGRIRLKEYFYSDEESDGDFSKIPAFRKKNLASVWTRIEIPFLKCTRVRSRRKSSGNPT